MARAPLLKTANDARAPEARLLRSEKAKTRGDERQQTRRRDTGTTGEHTGGPYLSIWRGAETRAISAAHRTAEKKATLWPYRSGWPS